MKIVYKNGSIPPEELIKHLALTGTLLSISAGIIRRHETLQKAEELGITASDEQLQAAADTYRSANGLYKASDMEAFMDTAGITLDDLEQFCEGSVLEGLVKDALFDDAKIEAYFVNNRSGFEYVRVSVITVADENLARELLLRIEEDGDDFHQLAREFSTDDTKYGGGYAGLVNRAMLPPEIAAKVFNTAAGGVTGPFPAEERFKLIYVEEVVPCELDDNLREKIKDILFSQWFQARLREGIRVEV